MKYIFLQQVLLAGLVLAADAPLGSPEFAPTPQRPLGWRGDGSGRYPGATCPASWNVETGAGVVWKAALPARGNGGVLADRDLIVVTAEPDLVLAFGRDGKERWRFQADPTLNLPAQRDAWLAFSREMTANPEAKTGKDAGKALLAAGIGLGDGETGWACHTPVSDGQRIYVSFRHGAVAALDRAGKVIWQTMAGPLGHGSPVLVEGKLLLPGTGKSVGLIALDAATGKVTYRVPVDKAAKVNRRAGEAALLPVKLGGTTVIVSASGFAYRLADGKVLGQELFPAGACYDAVAEGDVVYLPVGDDHAHGTQGVRAMKLALAGESVTAKMLWENLESPESKPGAAMIPVLVNDGLVYSFTAYKTGMKVRDAATGALVAGGGSKSDHTAHHFMANPVLVGDRLLQVGNNGSVALIQPGKGWKEVARLPLGAMCGSTPAAQGGRLYLRTATTLWCVGAKE